MIFELVKLKTWRDNIWVQVQGADVFKRVDEPGVQIEVKSTCGGMGRPPPFSPSEFATTPRNLRRQLLSL